MDNCKVISLLLVLVSTLCIGIEGENEISIGKYSIGK